MTTTEASAEARPAAERIAVLDAVRGLALFGILVVNAPLFLWPSQAIPLGTIPSPTVLDDAANTLVRFAFEGKFFTIFSLLFGIGVALQLGRGHPPRLILRRLLLLGLFGALHVTLFWWGDILLHYAILGVALVLTRRWSPRRLVRAALVLLAVPVVLQVGLAVLGSLAATSSDGGDAFAAAQAESDAALVAQAETALRVYGGGDVAAAAALRWGDWVFTTVGTLFSGMLLIVVAMFFLGAAAQRAGWLDADAAPRWRRLFVRALPLALGANAVYAWGSLSGVLYAFGTWPAALASVGRLALSTYLAQSLVMTTLAYAYGFGLYGSVSHAQALGLALALFALQLPIAVLYARRYRFGPAEWLWRAGTYGRRPS